MDKNKYLGPLCLIVAASIWGGMYVVSKIVLEVIPPLELVWIRYVIALVTLFACGLITRTSWKVERRDIVLILAIGVIGYAISITAQFYGTKLSSAQMGAVITSATPAFMVLFARFLLKEAITWKKALSVALATVGVLLIVGGGDLGWSNPLGGLVLLLAALTWALMSVLVKRVPSRYPQLAATTYAILIATVAMTPLAVGEVRHIDPEQLFQPTVLLGVLYLGTVSTAGAFFLWNKGLQLVSAGSGGLYFFFQPLVGTLLGWLILGEQVGFLFWIGSALILAGVLLVVKET